MTGSRHKCSATAHLVYTTVKKKPRTDLLNKVKYAAKVYANCAEQHHNPKWWWVLQNTTANDSERKALIIHFFGWRVQYKYNGLAQISLFHSADSSESRPFSQFTEAFYTVKWWAVLKVCKSTHQNHPTWCLKSGGGREKAGKQIAAPWECARNVSLTINW